jgi:hypothetical protein
MACKYCGATFNTFVWKGIELCNDNPECLDQAVIESQAALIAYVDDNEDE